MRHPYDDIRSTSPMAMMIDPGAEAISNDRPYRSIDPMRPEVKVLPAVVDALSIEDLEYSADAWFRVNRHPVHLTDDCGIKPNPSLVLSSLLSAASEREPR